MVKTNHGADDGVRPKGRNGVATRGRAVGQVADGGREAISSQHVLVEFRALACVVCRDIVALSQRRVRAEGSGAWRGSCHGNLSDIGAGYRTGAIRVPGDRNVGDRRSAKHGYRHAAMIRTA